MVSDVFYVRAVAAPLTVNTMDENVLRVLSDQEDFGEPMPTDGGDCDAVLTRFAEAGIDVDTLAVQLQKQAIDANVKSWIDLMAAIASKSAALIGAGSTGLV